MMRPYLSKMSKWLYLEINSLATGLLNTLKFTHEPLYLRKLELNGVYSSVFPLKGNKLIRCVPR